MAFWRNILGRPQRPRVALSQMVRRATVRARYDAAQTTDENTRHWAAADTLSANQANSPSVRAILRKRARHEAANNSYCRGIVNTLANDVIGTGPKLQVVGQERALARDIEAAWADWCDAVRLAAVLRTARTARAVDGESVMLLSSIPGQDVTLWPRLVEAEQVATPWQMETDVDGIILDAYGRPAKYLVLKEHPGESGLAISGDYSTMPAVQVIHHFRADRPGQYRGIPEITPALPLFAELRRYTLAVISAAETAADFAAVLYTDSAPDVTADVEPMDTVELERRMATTLPANWKLGQIDAKQPVTTYEMFKREILNEIARCLHMPYNIAACNSSSYNYASGRLDHQTYYRSIDVDRSDTVAVEIAPLFRAWYAEARLAIPALSGAPEHVRCVWLWDQGEHIDPAKEASAQATRLANGTSGLPAEYARRGLDWESELTTTAEALGITLPEYQALLRRKLFGEPTSVAPSSDDSDISKWPIIDKTGDLDEEED